MHVCVSYRGGWRGAYTLCSRVIIAVTEVHHLWRCEVVYYCILLESVPTLLGRTVANREKAFLVRRFLYVTRRPVVRGI
jgi:hypothetical protein